DIWGGNDADDHAERNNHEARVPTLDAESNTRQLTRFRCRAVDAMSGNQQHHDPGDNQDDCEKEQHHPPVHGLTPIGGIVHNASSGWLPAAKWMLSTCVANSSRAHV